MEAYRLISEMLYLLSTLLSSSASAYTFSPTTVTWHGGLYTVSEPTTLYWNSTSLDTERLPRTYYFETTGENIYSYPGKVTSGEKVLYTSK